MSLLEFGKLGVIYIRPGRTQTGMILYLYLVWFRDEIMFRPINTWLNQKHTCRLETSRPGLRFVVIYKTTVRTHTGVSSLPGLAYVNAYQEIMEADTNSCRPEFVASLIFVEDVASLSKSAQGYRVRL